LEDSNKNAKQNTTPSEKYGFTVRVKINDGIKNMRSDYEVRDKFTARKSRKALKCTQPDLPVFSSQVIFAQYFK